MGREDMYAKIAFWGQWIMIRQHGFEGTGYCYYLVENIRSKRHIGKIARRGRGKKWWFMPFNGAEFTHDCMADITSFMEQLPHRTIDQMVNSRCRLTEARRQVRAKQEGAATAESAT